MQLTLYTDYSLRVLIYLSVDPARVCTISEISDYYRISRNHLVKVVHNLSTMGYIDSYRGKGGGIKLAHPPATINIGEVVRKVEPNFNLVECFAHDHEQGCAVLSICGLKDALYEASQEFLKVLDRYTLEAAVHRTSPTVLPISVQKKK